MKGKRISRMLAILLVFMMVFTLIPCTALAEGTSAADDNITAYVSISKYGQFVTGNGSKLIACVPVTVLDQNNSGTFDIDDVLFAAHEKYHEGGAKAGHGEATRQYGIG